MNYKERNKELEKRISDLEEELQRKQAQEIPLPTEGTLSRVMHSATQLMALSSLTTGKFIDVNSYFLKVLGYERSQVIGKTYEDLSIFFDIEEINHYLHLVAKLKKIRDYSVTLQSKEGDKLPFLFSAEKVVVGEDTYLLAFFNPVSTPRDAGIRDSHGNVLEEIFNTVSSYLLLCSIDEEGRIHVSDINSKAERVEFVEKSAVKGKCIDDTPLVHRKKLIELLQYLRITGEAYKLAVSPQGDDSEGYYMGFPLTSGNIIITWESSYQQKFQEDLYRQREVFEKFAEMLPEMIYEVDLRGKVLYGNTRGLAFFGYSKEDLRKGLNIAEVFPESFHKMIENLRLLKSSEDITSNEYIGRKKDGTLVPIVTHTFPIFLDGKIIGYRGTVSDISRQKKYEEQIIREKAFLEHLIDSTPEAIAITDYPGVITMINKEFTKLFGFSPEEATGKLIDDLVVPEELREEAISIDELARVHHREIRQTYRRDKFGNNINVSLIATSIIVNNEVVAYLGIYRDITSERKNQLLQEILYNISSAALKQTDMKDLYPQIVQELSKIWDTNNFFIALYDKSSQTLSLPFFADEKDNFYEIPASKTITGWVIKNNKPVLLKENDLRLLEENGEIELVGTPCKVWMGVPLKVDNEIIGVMCLQDYNEEDKFKQDDLYVLDFIANQIALAIQRRMMLDNLIAARQRAEEAAQSKQLFMSTMSHEIRTPLNEVIGITNLLLQGNPREDQMDYIKTLRFSGNHLLTLVNDVLDYNKMESGKIVFEQTQFNLNDFLDEIMRSYSFRSKSKHLTFSIKKDEKLPPEVIGDPIRLNQILSNLLSNALKFTNTGGVEVSINESGRSKGKVRLEFSVTDTGIGIAEDKHKSIFESFTQATSDTTRHYGGTGLGLAICKKLVELQGGNITIKSAPEKGSTFTFTLEFGISDKKTGDGQAELPENYSGLEGKRILVAEDNKINFFVANKFLISWGINVTHAENGQIALDLLEKNEYDLILMDLHMPVLDGIEATKIIRESEDAKIRDIPIVALTAAIMSENHDKIEELNINDYVLKPFKPHDLFERIRKHIR